VHGARCTARGARRRCTAQVHGARCTARGAQRRCTVRDARREVHDTRCAARGERRGCAARVHGARAGCVIYTECGARAGGPCVRGRAGRVVCMQGGSMCGLCGVHARLQRPLSRRRNYVGSPALRFQSLSKPFCFPRRIHFVTHPFVTRCSRLILYPIPYTLYPIPYTLYPIPCTLYPIPYTLNPIHYTLYPKPYSLYPIP
jgi:hypothetical protein